MKLSVGDTAPDFQFDTPGKRGLRFYNEIGETPAVMVFLRYIGCPVCQMEMAGMKRDIGLFREKGVRVFVLLQSDCAVITAAADSIEWPFTVVCDPDGKIFADYGVAPGGLLRYLHPSGLVAAIRATFQGYRHGKFEGKETQVPAAFILSPQKVIQFVHYGKTISDVPPASVLAGHL